MNLNSNIIMAGQQPDIVNALARSSQAAGLTNRVRRDNRLNQLYQEQGAGLLSGDQNALNALAAQDPRQALQFQQVHQQNERQARQDALSEQEFAFRIQKWAQQASDAEAAKEAEEYKTLVHMAATAETPEQWDQIVTQYGGDDGQELIGQFGNRDALLGKYMTAAQIIEQSKPPKPADEYGRYAAEERAAGREPLSRIDYKRAGQKNMRVTSDGEGGFTVEETFGAGGKRPVKTTEGEKSAAGYLSRMQAAEKELETLSVDEPAVRSITSLIVGGSNFEGLALSERQQRILQAQRDWVRAKLRKESGAVIGDQEMAEEVRTYFPLPGETEAQIAQKARSRKEAEKQFEIMSGNAAPEAEDPAGANDNGDAAPDFEAMSTEELKAWIAANE